MNFDIPIINIALYFIVLLTVACGLVYLSGRYRRLPFCAPKSQRIMGAEERKWRVVLLAVMLICCVMLTMLLSTSWIGGDDWRNIFCRGNAYSARIPDTLNYYFTFVSRVGDIFIWMFGQSFGRIETNIATALAAVLSPLAFYKLCKDNASSIFSARGVAYYFFAFMLCLVGVCLSPWRNYFCWAAVINYLIPTLATVYFLSFYRSDSLGQTDSKVRCIALFALGIFCGWGTECGDIVLIPALIIYALYCKSKKNPWAPSRLFGMLGTWFGAGLLFASPALQNRSDAAREAMSVKIAEMSPNQVQMFLEHLNWDKANMLQGAGGVIFIGDFSFVDKLRFLPLLLERFWECCHIGVASLGLLLMFAMLLCAKGKRMRLFVVALVGLLVSGFMACSYLASCIPWWMSFLPPCFVLVGTCCYLFLRLERSVLFAWIPAILITVFSLFVFVPAGIEAQEYKKYELAQYAEIKRQLESGITDIVLPYPYEKDEPLNKLDLIKAGHISQDPEKNGFILQVIRQNISSDIQSIRQLQRPTTK